MTGSFARLCCAAALALATVGCKGSPPVAPSEPVSNQVPEGEPPAELDQGPLAPEPPEETDVDDDDDDDAASEDEATTDDDEL